MANRVFISGNLGTDIKEAMSGGSVAVVGINTVEEKNIIDDQDTERKTKKEPHESRIMPQKIHLYSYRLDLSCGTRDVATFIDSSAHTRVIFNC